MGKIVSNLLSGKLIQPWIIVKGVFIFFIISYINQLSSFAELTNENNDPIILDLYNYPNPFDPADGPTHIVYELSEEATAEILIYDYSGDLVLKRKFLSGTLGGLSGTNTFDWNAKNDDGDEVIEGAYICILRVLVSEKGSQVFERKSTKIGVMRQ